MAKGFLFNKIGDDINSEDHQSFRPSLEYCSVYSISEFNQREQGFYQLRVARNISGQSSDAVSARGGVQAFAAEAKSSEPFEPGVIKANAQVYVVYLLN